MNVTNVIIAELMGEMISALAVKPVAGRPDRLVELVARLSMRQDVPVASRHRKRPGALRRQEHR